MRNVLWLFHLSWIILSQLAHSATIPEGAQRLLSAYPDQLIGFENGSIIWRDGTRMIYDDGKTKTPEETLDQADLEDMLATPYPKGLDYPTPVTDPGRVRNEAFFQKMYAASEAEVKAKMVSVTWMPQTAPQQVSVININGLPEKFRAISKELEALPADIKKTVFPSAGTFKWRVISGTHRLSTHSFGIAIDLNTQYSHYWRWTKSKEKPGPYQNKMPLEVVLIFERYGFIWGGKWQHYDTMHFEYRPELIQAEKSATP